MSEARSSLVDAESAALLPGMELPAEIEERIDDLQRERPGVLTGERVFQLRPDAYRVAVRLLARGMSIRDVAAVVEMSTATVLSIRRREGGSVLAQQAKQDLSSTLAEVATLGAEQVRERLLDGEERIPLDKLMLATAIATDKAMLLAGQATQRVEHVVAEDVDADFARDLERWRERGGQVIEAEVVDMGICRADAGANGGASDPAAVPGDAQGALVPVARGADTLSSDDLSEGDRDNVQEIVDISQADTPMDTSRSGFKEPPPPRPSPLGAHEEGSP